MAYFTARDGKPSDYCQDAVGRCDVYVGLIGLRYGSVVPDRPRVSYTELEFDAATEAGLTRLIFLLDENTALPIPPAQLHDNEPGRRARQLAFRDRLRGAGLTVHTVTTPENLELALYQALLENQPAAQEAASRPGERAPGVRQQVWELRGHRPDPYFTGREDELAAVHRALRVGSATSAIQVITGLGGLGKTRLVVEYAWRHADAYEVVWWVRAEDPATMRGDYVELAQALGLPSEKEDQAIAALRQELQPRRDWLLVFDNAEDPGELFPLLPDRHSGHVLITSRRQEWPHAESRHIDVLSAHAAAGYLQRRGRVTDADTAKKLAESLGYLPLALAQAASVIGAGMGTADYLDLLHEQSPELFAAGKPADHDITIDSTWRVSVDRLASRSPAAVALFRLAAFLGADAVPLAQLSPTAAMPAELSEIFSDPFLLNEATAALGEYSLAEAADGLLSIHRMVQAVTRSELGGDAPRWASLALTTLADAFPGNVEDPRAWGDCESLLAHVLTCAGHAEQLHIDTAVTVQLLDRAARYLLARGRLGPAAAVLGPALTTAERLHHNDLAYLSYRNSYGLLLLAQGNLSAARAAQEEVYQARTQILGAEDPGTLRAGRDLVEVLYRQGHWVQAAQLQDRLVEAFTAVLGPDNPETITSLAYQATILRSNGHYAQARAIEEQVVEARTRLLGAEHPLTLTAQGNLAATLRALGELGQARTIQEQVVEARTRLLGAEHPLTLTAQANLANTLYALGEAGQARAIEEQVVEASTRLLGAEHPDALTAQGNLAVTLRALGELRRARTIQEQVVEARTRLLGAEHPDTLSAQASLAATLRALGELRRARAIEEQVVEARTRLQGAEHPDTLSAQANLAATLDALGEAGQARAIQEEVLEARTRLQGAEHPDTLSAQGNLANTLRALGELGQARAIEEQVVEARTRLQGAEHPDTLTARNNLAATLDALGEAGQARAIQEQVLEARTRLQGAEHPDTLGAQGNLANMLRALGELGQARAIEEQVVEASTRLLGAEHPSTLTAQANLAATLYAQGNNKEASSLLTESLAISLRVFGKKHTATTRAAWQLAQSCGSHEKAKRTAIIMVNLSWLNGEPSSQLTVEQKKIKNQLKGSVHGGKKVNRRKKKRR
jgi:2'-5' RNA ligase